MCDRLFIYNVVAILLYFQFRYAENISMIEEI